MIEPRYCPACNAELPADAPEGLCPACLIKAGLGSGSGPVPLGEPTAASPPRSGFTPPTPDELAGRFPQLEILELLGQGGMGAVYKARQPHLDRLVALKILPPEVAADATFAERFTREARAMARLNHPHIVIVYDFGQADGLYYLLMEYVEGVNLRQAIQGGQLTPKESLAIVSQVCDALQFAHDEGVVHRDIKPENILLDKRGRVKIADFGLAKLLGREQTVGMLTGTHQVMGTLHYMAPEQMLGSRTVDHRADIYSLGVVFYELLTGELPLGRFEPPSQKVQIDVRLDEVVLRALAKEPERRYQKASDIKTEVESIQAAVSHTSALVRPLVSAEVARQKLKGPRAGLLVAGVVSILACLAVLLWSGWTLARIAAAPAAKETTKQGDMTRTVTPQVDQLPSKATLWGLVIGSVLALGLAAVMLLATEAMRRLEFYRLAWAGGILGMVPYSPGWLLGLPMGLWACLQLRKPEVRLAFDRVDSGDEAAAGDGGLNTLAAWSALTCFLGFLATFLPWAELNIFGFVQLQAGFDHWMGISAGAAFAVGLVLLVAIVAVRPRPLAQGLVCLLAAGAALSVTSWCLWDSFRGFQVTSSSSTGDAALGGLAKALLDSMLQQIRIRPMWGIFVALALGVGLLGLGVFQLRKAIGQRTEARREQVVP